MGDTFVALQCVGGIYVMQLLFRNSAMHLIPGSLIYFNSYRGMSLMPELLFALKCASNTVFSSVIVMNCSSTASMGVNLSAGRDWS
jgi:hypothetical protein